MGNLCYRENKEAVIISGIHLSETKEEKNNKKENNSNNINNNKIVVFNFKSRFAQKKLVNDEVHKIKNKNTIKNINRRTSLINKYKLNEDKFEKFIKFTHFNKNISSTTNSFLKQ